MNSSPASSNARRNAALFAAVSAIFSPATSARRTVFTPSADSRARAATILVDELYAALLTRFQTAFKFAAVMEILLSSHSTRRTIVRFRRRAIEAVGAGARDAQRRPFPTPAPGRSGQRCE